MQIKIQRNEAGIQESSTIPKTRVEKLKYQTAPNVCH
jgi:hypothetical protein